MPIQKNSNYIELVSEMAETGSGYFEDYYEESALGELEPSDPYYGRNVIWDGIGGRMIRVYPENIQPIEGNIFDPDKLAAVRDGIIYAEDRVVLIAPYGTVTVIDLQDVKESIENSEYNPYEVLTTGDEDLDLWLVDPDDFLAQEGYDPEDLKEYLADRDAYLESWSNDPIEQVEKEEEMKDALDRKREMDRELSEAVAHQNGDLGDFRITIRDGNHRAFGALLAEEPYIYMILEDNQFQYLDPEIESDKKILEALD